MSKKRSYSVTALGFFVLAILATGCKEKRQLAVAKGNSVEYARAQCECEKLKKKQPPGDLTRCTEQMARATRYLNINLEFGNFNAAERQEIRNAGAEAFTRCMASP